MTNEMNIKSQGVLPLDAAARRAAQKKTGERETKRGL